MKKNTKSNNTVNLNLTNPTKAGTYKVVYRRAKSYETNVGTAKFTKKGGWTNLIGKSGKPLENTFNNPLGTANAKPSVVGWIEP
jgi:hypothetical protein